QSEVAREAALYFDAGQPSSIAAAIVRIARDEPLRERLVAAGQHRLQAFTVEKLVRGHLQTFQAACRRHGRLHAWLNDRVRLPRSLEERSELTDRERRAAARLLRERSQLPSNYERAQP